VPSAEQFRSGLHNPTARLLVQFLVCIRAPSAVPMIPVPASIPLCFVDFPEWTVLQFLLSFSPSWISIPRCATESILVPHPLLSPGSGACRAATIPGSSCDDAVFFSLSPYAKSVAFVLLLVSSVAA
jgi:hypothetical protein